MDKLKFFLGIFTLFFGLIINAQAQSNALSYDYEISHKQIMEKLSSNLPVQKSYLQNSIILSLNSPIQLDLGNKIENKALINSIIIAKIMGSNNVEKIHEIKSTVSFSLRYNAENKSFWLDNFDCIDFDVKNYPESLKLISKKLVNELFKNHFSKKPVYVLGDNDKLINKTASILLKKVSISKGKIIATLSVI